MADPGRLRISIVLSGGASLGAYQAGAVAALLAGARRVEREAPGRLAVDGLAGASAGALVAFFAAEALLEGLDPVEVLHDAWVDRLTLDLLHGGRPGEGPLAVRRLREAIPAYVRERAGAAEAGRSAAPLTLLVALTGLQGLTYPIRQVRRDEEFAATTYVDWARFDLDPARGGRQLLEPEGRAPLDAVLASAAHPGAFAPARLDRSADEAEYRRRGIRDFPDAGTIWYTDGGLVQAKPLGRLLAALRERDGDGGCRRAVVLVDPKSEGPSGARTWTDPGHRPGWLDGLARALAILPAQALYDDARRVEKRNTRIEWADELVRALDGRLDEETIAALGRVLDRIERDRAALPSDERHRGREDVLHRVVAEVAGLAGKEVVDVNVVSPLLLAEAADGRVPRLLAGEFMGDFGGFLDRDLRESDFLLGYASTGAWLPGGLADTGFDDALLAAMADEVEAQSPGDWRRANRGGAGVRQLGWPARRRIARLCLDAVRALLQRR